jgi:glycosyltransferase involved in cell wall biosynthesis
VPPSDSAALGTALASLAVDPALRARIGEAARGSVVPRFNAERYVESIVSIYDELLARPA